MYLMKSVDQDDHVFAYCIGQGIIQKKSASGSRTLPLVIFDKNGSSFSKNSVILRYFWVKLRPKCPFLKILDAALEF